jgi:hypothetical protein
MPLTVRTKGSAQVVPDAALIRTVKRAEARAPFMKIARPLTVTAQGRGTVFFCLSLPPR